jgi:HPt (histidine-containing phosphotransfer) domain-containing protein
MNIGQPSASSDLTPLSWVQEEVRRQLEAVNKVLRRQLREFDLRQAGGQLDAAALASVLQTQALQLHQVSGVLRLVNLDEGHRLMQAAESLLVRCAGDATLRTEQVEAVERAGFALLTYMTRSVSGARPSPLALFPAYRRLQELNQAERIHPADFWPQHFEWRTLPPPQLVDAGLPSLDALRTSFEGALLRQMRETSATHAASLAELCAGIGLALRREPQQSFWQLAAAHFEAQAQGMLASDQLVKRMASRLLTQLRNDLRGSTEVSDRLVQDLLFFCAQSGEPKPGQAPRLRAVRAAYGIDEAEIGDYRDDSLGRIDPAWVQQAMRRVSAAKEAWSACAEGDMVRAAALDDASGHLAESLVQLFAGGEHLGQTLQRAAVVTLRSGGRPPAALAMEVASALLYLEAALEDGEYDQPSQRTRIERLAQRVQAAATGKPEEQLESWMEDLFRRVGDRQTLGSVMQELRANLGEVERATDEYFRDPTRRAALIPVPGQLQAMRGVFTVLGLDDAATTCVRMRDEIDRLSNTEVDASLAGPRAVFERLATNLGQLGFLIDMLSVQAPLAKSMFRFDEEKGELVAAVGREKRSFDAPAPVAPAPAFEDTRPLDVSGPETAAPAAAPLRPLGLDELDLPDLELPDLELPLSEAASAAEASRWSDSLQNAATEPMPLDAVLPVREPAESLPSFSLDLSSMPSEPPSAAPSMAPVVAAIPAPAAPEASDAEDIDAEMLEIFLEEALEVVGNARRALEGLREQPADRAEFTNLRRAFHTLKGSGRMVGLNAFGEGAWACEQLFNARLGSEAPADAALLNFAAQALDELDAWRGELAEGGGAARSPQGLRERADRLRLGELAAASVERRRCRSRRPCCRMSRRLNKRLNKRSNCPSMRRSTRPSLKPSNPIWRSTWRLRPAPRRAPTRRPTPCPWTSWRNSPRLCRTLIWTWTWTWTEIEAPPAFDATQALEVQVAEPAELSVDIPLISLEESVEFPAEPIEQAVTLDLDLPEPAPIVQAEALPDLVLDLGDEPAWEGEPDEAAPEAAALDQTHAPDALVLDLLGEEALPPDEPSAGACAEERSEVEVEAQRPRFRSRRRPSPPTPWCRSATSASARRCCASSRPKPTSSRSAFATPSRPGRRARAAHRLRTPRSTPTHWPATRPPSAIRPCRSWRGRSSMRSAVPSRRCAWPTNRRRASGRPRRPSARCWRVSARGNWRGPMPRCSRHCTPTNPSSPTRPRTATWRPWRRRPWSSRRTSPWARPTTSTSSSGTSSRRRRATCCSNCMAACVTGRSNRRTTGVATPACAPCTPSRAAHAWPAPCSSASWRTCWNPMCSPCWREPAAR